MQREILPAADKRLRIKSKPVSVIDKKIRLLIKDLKQTLLAQKDPEGIGLAAPQIGKNVQVFIIKPGEEIRVFINPKILATFSPKSRKKGVSKNIMEGCLSLPHFYGPIKRAQKIKIEFIDEEGRKRVETFEGLSAQIIQHEIDHLNGILFIDRLLEQKKPLYEYKNGEWEKVEI